MAVAFVVGKSLVAAEEISAKAASGSIRAFQEESAVQPAKASIALGGRNVTAAEIESVALEAAEVPTFTPIGLGKPMSIEILTIYSGDAPSTGFLGFGRRPDALVASAVKGVETFGAQPRAVNQIIQTIEDNQLFGPSALRDGSPIVYYTPSLTMDTTLCAFEVVADTFDAETFGRISGLFSKAAGLPVFAPAAQYLLAGSALIDIFTDLGKAFLETNPFLSAELNLYLDTPGLPVAVASHAVIYNDRDAKQLEGFSHGLVERGPGKKVMALVDGQGRVYQGPAPYLIVSIDGRARANLESFKPTIASAAMLDRFYRKADRSGTVVDSLGKAMELYNDYVNREKALRMKARLDEATPDTPEYAELEKLYDAYVGNIQGDLFKLEKA